MFFDHAIMDAFSKGALLSAFGLVWIILLVRIVGLRSFSKMTNFDFVMTIAMGSLLASTATTQDWTGLVQVVTAMTMLFAVQFSVAFFRHRFSGFDRVLQNTPVLLMKDGKFIRSALRRTRVSEEDVLAKLREANVLQLADVRAVVLETTGDVSVLHGENVSSEMIAKIVQLK